MRDLWYKNAIIYCLDVDTFQDSDGDGIGDFAGLTNRLSYIAGMGFNTIWLLPIHPSPFRDNGYDITDYFNVAPRLGTLGDFVEFMHRAHDRGIRVMIDLVVNHTSNEHPWFQAARSGANNPYHDFYVWQKGRPKHMHDGMVFPGVQKSTWTHDRKAGEYYFHRFYDFEPDLNIGHPSVREQICRIIGLWLELGVSGFRVDAAPFLIEMKGAEGGDTIQPYRYLSEFREFLSWRSGDAILLAEANVAMDQVLEYFGSGERLHMLFNFMLNQYTMLALARQEASPLMEGMLAPPPVPEACQWATFLRNHDELDLARLTEAQRQEVFAAFGPQKNMQLYGRGIRRRLAPMLDNNLRRLKLAYSLLFSLPGTPVIRYGEEIGMGDDLTLTGRDAIRTPMQWSREPNAGFSTAPSKKLVRPVIRNGEYGCQRVNVAAQLREPDSLLNFVERCIRARTQSPELGWGQARIIETGESAVFAHSCTWQDSAIVAVHNLADKACKLKVDVSSSRASRAVDILGSRNELPVKRGRIELELEGYDHRWLRLRTGS